MEIISGKIIDIKPDGQVVIVGQVDNVQRLIDRHYDKVQIGLPDGRSISDAQRRKAWSLMAQIGDWAGYYGTDRIYDHIYKPLRHQFTMRHVQSLTHELFHLSRADMTTACEFIDYLIEFMVQNDVPSRYPLWEKAENPERFTYACLANRKCCVCGQCADLHHVDVVGMGRNRDEICQVGMRVLPLCRLHHTEYHDRGPKPFFESYHLTPIKLTEQIMRKFKKTYHFTDKNISGS